MTHLPRGEGCGSIHQPTRGNGATAPRRRRSAHAAAKTTDSVDRAHDDSRQATRRRRGTAAAAPKGHATEAASGKTRGGPLTLRLRDKQARGTLRRAYPQATTPVAHHRGNRFRWSAACSRASAGTHP